MAFPDVCEKDGVEIVKARNIAIKDFLNNICTPLFHPFKSQIGDKKINGVALNFIEVDCDKDTATSDKYNVKGFPTIKLVRGNQIIEYDAKPSTVNLLEFVNSSLA